MRIVARVNFTEERFTGTMSASLKERGKLPYFGEQGKLACIIHERFCCNRRYVAATSLTAGGLAARSVNILFQVCLPPSRLRAPVSFAVSEVSS